MSHAATVHASSSRLRRTAILLGAALLLALVAAAAVVGVRPVVDAVSLLAAAAHLAGI